MNEQSSLFKIQIHKKSTESIFYEYHALRNVYASFGPHRSVLEPRITESAGAVGRYVRGLIHRLR